MARLSVEHYRANATMTPDHVRKSSRFRDIFRSRSSSNNSLVDTMTRSSPVKSPLSPPTSPTSPTIRPGFDQVGLLPSEQEPISDVKQALQDSGGCRVAQALENQVRDLRGVSVPHNLDTRLDMAGVGTTDEAAKNFQETEKTREVNQIAEAFKDAMMENKSQRAEGVVKGEPMESVDSVNNIKDVPLRSLSHSKSQEELREKGRDSAFGDCDESETPRFAIGTHGRYLQAQSTDRTDISTVTIDENHNPKSGTSLDPETTSFDGRDRSLGLQHRQPKFTFPSATDQDKRHGRAMFTFPDSGTFYNADSDKEGSDTFFNTSEDGDRRSTGSSFASNIFDGEDSHSQGIREYVASKIAESEHVHMQDTAVADIGADSMVLSFRAEIKQRKNRSDRFTDPARAGRSKLFGTPKAAGNMIIKDIALASVAQLGVVMVYVWVALIVLFRGPAHHDLFLDPLEWMKDIVVDQIVHVASKVFERVVVVLAETLRAVADDVKVEPKTE
ncbi:hypothetical protein SNOG_12317 [Parastagonospora nodorum SN15]|uniref:Uncharacterized protein n=1 Tax=Phaeosphaeria nodorum (strain SN15 / ATCC MYA-4574 / FGSC 10173) TaxID=321614 RepID=Q0U7E7_PHANO|nr:hypothetical protein SNOG_12317 [Parastagonospora nodorum SN15]EAT80130.2 hypothetical protein SNOG_12317 [Parastagonospora nodorum SN15]